MLKFGLGVLAGLTIYGLALAKVMKDEELWNKFIEDVDTRMGYGSTTLSTDSMDEAYKFLNGLADSLVNPGKA